MAIKQRQNTGVLIGSIAGFFGGRVDQVLMRFVDIFKNSLIIIQIKGRCQNRYGYKAKAEYRKDGQFILFKAKQNQPKLRIIFMFVFFCPIFIPGLSVHLP